MPGGFNLGETSTREIKQGTLLECIHASVDQMMASMSEHSSDGCSGVFDYHCPVGAPTHTHQVRIMIQDITGEKLCSFCNGTGVDGS